MFIKTFSHVDLDGVTCPLIMNFINNLSYINVEYSNYDTINADFEKFIFSDEAKRFHKIFITDLSIDYNLAKKITDKGINNITLIDHHKTALELTDFDWCICKITDNNGVKVSASKLVYEYFEPYLNHKNALYKYTNIVDLYDTYLWKLNNNLEPKYMNDLYHVYGRGVFFNHVKSCISNDNFEGIMGPVQKELVAMENQRIEKFIKRKDKEMKRVNFEGHEIGIVCAEEIISELGHTLGQLNPDLSYIMIFNFGYRNVSFRTSKKGIDVSAIAAKYGGGGHEQASGCPITPELMQLFMSNF